MNIRNKITAILLCATTGMAMAQSATDSVAPQVSGTFRTGVSMNISDEEDKTDLVYSTNDPRLGTNSGNHYLLENDAVSQNIQADYGLSLNVDLHPQHSLAIEIEGSHELERLMGTTEEQLSSADGKPLSYANGRFDNPDEQSHDMSAGIEYTYRTRRKGEELTVGYNYNWQGNKTELDQQIYESEGWNLYKHNVLKQITHYQYHHAHIDYVRPVAKGHLLDFGLAYDRRKLSVRTNQDWDNVRRLDTDYRHLTQYGGVHARYRLRLGPVEAMARLEYRATKMQNRWLHDVLPLATIRYHVDSIHSLSAFYTILLIRPDAQHLDTNRIVDTYTQRFGNDKLVGVHVHNTALTYHMHLPKVDCSAEVRYLTATDGLNAIWMERNNNRIYTWGNEGVRHAVGLTPKVEGRLSQTTQLNVSATVMWDKRIAEAINLANANWGVQAKMSLKQHLVKSAQQPDSPYDAWINLHGDYSYHNTLDVYSYADHGGSVGLDMVAKVRKLHLSAGYTCQLQPIIHITQGAYVGKEIHRPGATHYVAVQMAYNF